MISKGASRGKVLAYVRRFSTVLSVVALTSFAEIHAADRTQSAVDSSRYTSVANVSDSSLFLPAVTYPGGIFPTAIDIADVNGDGISDLLIADAYDSLGDLNGGVSVLLGNGDGTFAATTSYSSGGKQAMSIAVADLNGDGKPDVVVSNFYGVTDFYGGVAILMGNGNGTFQAPVIYKTGGHGPDGVAVADVNGDRRQDIVATNFTSSTVAVLLGNGDGTFQAGVTYGAGGLYAKSVALPDVNRDGMRDIVVFNECDRFLCSHGTVGVLLGNGDGSFQVAKAYSSGGWEFSDPLSLAVADVDGDGRPDLLVSNGCASSNSCPNASIGVLLGNGDGTFRPVSTYASGAFSASIAVADVNGDGELDVVVADEYGPDGVGVLLGNGDGTFQPVQMYSSGGGADAVALADLNGDGKPDAVALHGHPDGTVGVLMNNAPFCATPLVVTLSAAPKSLWPPNGKMVPVAVSGTITDTGCSVTNAAYAVTDKYGEVQPSGPVTVSPGGAYSFIVWLQASRLGTDRDGRLYTVTVSASNKAGKTGSQAAMVIVPHDQGH
jgi:hypothetical protein